LILRGAVSAFRAGEGRHRRDLEEKRRASRPSGVNGAIRNYFNMLPMMPGGAEIKQKLSAATHVKPEEYRWSAD
jgi:hypothetical protein